MTPTPMIASIANKNTSPWKQRLFQVAIGFLVLTLVSPFFALIGALLMIVWVARRPESGSKRSGAFALTCGILSLPAGAITYFIVQFIQSGDLYQEGGLSYLHWILGMLSTVLFVFGVSTLIIGIIKRINA